MLENKIVIAPKLINNRHWVIYRPDGVEVSFEISDGLTIIRRNKSLMKKEINFIKKHIIPNFRFNNQ